jgi:metal-dependent HD superfamily phosphatase/phosphodiesterase
MNEMSLDAEIASFLSQAGEQFYRQLLTATPYLDAANQMVITRMGYNDHGLIHSKIVTRNALLILDIIKDRVPPTIIKERLGDYTDVQLVVMAGAFLHDVGNLVHRHEHSMHSCYIASQLLFPVLPQYTDSPAQLLSEILHCIYSHHDDTHCLTTEAGIVTIADGCDMAEGRARIPYQRGKIDIHSVSALSIKDVVILKGDKTPLKIEVYMDSQAGIFQIQNVFGPKVKTSGLEDHLQIFGIYKGKLLPITL